MKLLRNTILSTACLLALSAGALAQEKDSPAQDERVPIAGKTTIGVTVEETQLVAPGWRASKLMKTEVTNDMNEKIGKVDDLIVAPDGTISVAIVDVSKFLGMDKHKVAIPVRNFKKLTAGKATLPGATKEELQKLPPFKYTD